MRQAMRFDMAEGLTHPGPSVPAWWREVMAREQAKREAGLMTAAGDAARQARNEAVLRVMRARVAK